MSSIILRHLLAFIFSFFSCFYLIPVVAHAASLCGILDIPDGKIKCHDSPVPYLGGLAVFISFIVSLALIYPFENKILWLLLGSTLLLLVGLIDDLKVLKPGHKFGGQVIAVLCFLKGGFSLRTLFFSSFINLLLSAFWMLSLINAFNLIDVMDGLASLVALVSAVVFLIIALLLKQFLISLLLVAFIGSVCAFFLYNKPPAKIYLGDAGSMFLGGFLAAVPLLFSWSERSLYAHYAPLVILAVPLLEVFFLIVIRTWNGLPFYKGSPHHFSVYLQKKGWTKYRVLFFALCMEILFSFFAVLFIFNYVSFFSLLISCCILLFIWCYVIFTPLIFKDKSSSLRENLN